MLDLLAKEVTYVDLGTAALYAVIGLLVVFIGIAFLVLVVWLLGLAFAHLPQKFEKKEKVVEKVETPAPTMAVEDLDEQTVAVITAAIAAYYQKENKKCDFTVKRIKRL